MTGLRALHVGALALALLLVACGAPASEAPVNTPARPAIVSLNPCSDAILAEVADPAQVLAISHYSKDPRSSSMDVASARLFPATRGTVEEVLSLQPDLVIGTSFMDPATEGAYNRLGLRLEKLGIAHDLEENRAQIRQIAALAGHPERGDALIARIDDALAAAALPPGAEQIDAVVWQGGGIVPGGDTLILDLLRRTGFANFSVEQGLGQADYLSLEAMLAHPPQVILTTGGTSFTGEGSNRALAHPVLDRLEGTARRQLDPRFLYCGGPTIIDAVQRLAQIRSELVGQSAS